jgi:predicted nuclease of predicted toxin-antitoxin system
VKLLVDHQLPAALARHLSGKGVDCIHVADMGLAQASDSEIWAYVKESRRAIITKDEDFFHRASKELHCQVVWVRLGNCRNEALLAAFDRTWSRIAAALAAGERVIEIR